MHRHVCVTVAALFDCLFPSEVHSFAVTHVFEYASTAQLVRSQSLQPERVQYEQVNMWLNQNLSPRTMFLLQKVITKYGSKTK